MKAIIYAGIALFSVATVYGVADYYSSKKKGTLDKLYVEEETAAAPPKVEEKITTVIPIKNAEAVKAVDEIVVAEAKPGRKVKKHKKPIKMEDFSRARIPEEIRVEEVKEVPVKKQEEPRPEKAETAPVEKVITERKLSLDMYSRAPLKKMAKPVKKEVSKD